MAGDSMTPVSLLHHLFKSFCPENAALVSGEGEVLFLRSNDPLAYGTLGHAAQTVIKYLPLKTGEVALLNDPYSGGTTLNEYTFVSKIFENTTTSIWLALREKKAPSTIIGKTIEEEGLRIPPTPIFQGGQLNQFILDAMKAHPLFPPHLDTWIAEVCKKLETHRHSFNRVVEAQKNLLSKNNLKDYVARSAKIVREKIGESSSGETRVEIILDSKEMIRLHMDIHEGLVKMDFGGTTTSQNRFLTESATYGICLEALSRFYEFNDFINTGSFSILQITKPTQCLLNAKYPASLSLGALSVKSALQSAISLALSQIHLKKQRALCAFCPVELEVKTQDAEMLYLRLPGGAGARPEETENSSAALNQPFPEDFAIEKWERKAGIRLVRLDYRNESAQAKSQQGGRGLNLEIQALQDVQVQWRTDFTQARSKVAKNASASTSQSNAVLLHEGDQEKPQAPTGMIQLRAGTSMIFRSGSGGSWGSAN